MSETKIKKRAITSWVLYDLANTIFSMGVVSTYFPLWVRDQVGVSRADVLYTSVTSLSMGIIFLISPLLGALSDRAARRMPFLVVSTLGCVLCTFFLGRAGMYSTLGLFILANIFYQAATQFYDSLLPSVSSENSRARIGGIGIGVGYLGSYIAVLMGLFLGTENKTILFSLQAVSFLLLALPCFFFVRERRNAVPIQFSLAGMKESTLKTIRTLRDTKRHPGLLRFLVGRVFYTDAINTVISVMVLYVVNVVIAAGLSKTTAEHKAQIIMLIAISFAILGGFFFGWLSDRIGSARSLLLVLRLWLAIFLLAAFVGIFELPLFFIYIVACGSGFALGGVWSCDRPRMLELAPPNRIGEFYGLYGMVGRFSAITGPGIWALSTYIAIERFQLRPHVGQGVSILVLFGMILGSYLILRKDAVVQP